MTHNNANTSAAAQSRFTDLSLWGVIAGNVFSIIMAAVQDWDLYEIAWVYWIQSVIIGVINYIRMRSLKEFSTKNLSMNKKAVPETPEGRDQVARFFLFHYGAFHVVYAMFLWQEQAITALDASTILFIILCAAGFLGAHSYSFAHNLSRDFKQQKPNIGTLMFYPYLRIIPMHLAILGANAWGTGGALYFFLGLKTLADAGMHMVEHHLFQKAEKKLHLEDGESPPHRK